jgi:BirA family transcriptional regulator, biotin operon repressor / biotin---[acetyl-CoA-carboxylase] ligase
MIAPETIRNGFHGPNMPQTISWYEQLGSTMDVCRELLPQLSDSELPLLVGAEEQLAGRGRRGRDWVAPAGSGLLFSLALRPRYLTPDQGIALIWAMAVAACEGIQQATGLVPRLKWPNDLLLNYGEPAQWHKIAGMLLEATSDQHRLTQAIIGCGINIHTAPPPASVRYPAGYLAAAAGAPPQRLPILQAILQRTGYWFTQLEAGNIDTLFATWEALLHTIGTEIAIHIDDVSLNGHAEAVDQSGALLLRDKSGTLHRITSGDVGLINDWQQK